MRAVGVGEGNTDEGIRVERKGLKEGEKMTAKGGPFMDVEADCFFRLSAKVTSEARIA